MKKHPFLSDQLRMFTYWIKERHAMHVKRELGEDPPWSDNETMNSVFFTNPYRENDKVTVWFRNNMREPLRNKPEVFFATVAFRRFNSIQTGEVLLSNNLHLKWDAELAEDAINDMRNMSGLPYLSAAYMISAPAGCDKLNFLCACNSEVWNRRQEHVKALENLDTLEGGWDYLNRKFNNVGPFIAYEWITDLRHTYLFEDAPDKMTWCAFGPGAIRGLNRLLFGNPGERMKKPKNALSLARDLLYIVKDTTLLKGMPPFELREIEHSLCEFDKFQRVNEGGRPKRWYNAFS